MRCRLELDAWQVRQRVGWLPREAKLIFIREPKPYGWDISWFAILRAFDEDQFLTIPVIKQAFIVTTNAANQTYTSDATWNNGNNKIETIGGGGAGGGSNTSGTRGSGGGGAIYSTKSNQNIFATPGTTTAPFFLNIAAVGAANGTGGTGSDVWFNGATLAASTVGSKGGTGGAASQGAAGVGNTAGSIGAANNGGAGAVGVASGTAGGGGGAGGPSGAGGAASTNVGGTADNGTVAGGTAANPGNSGTELGDGVHGCGSGAGGPTATGNGLTGGNYGGAGSGSFGASSLTGGTAGQGIIVLTWSQFTAAYLSGPFDLLHIWRNWAVEGY